MNATTGVRHPITMVMRARELHAAEWGLTGIQDRLEQEFGRRPHHSTVLRWIDPKEATTQRTKAQQFARRRAEKRHRQRMVALAEAGLTCESIAVVLRLDTGQPFTPHKVRYALKLAGFRRSTESRSCVVCGETFPLSGERGRPPTRCPKHARPSALAAA